MKHLNKKNTSGEYLSMKIERSLSMKSFHLS